jgi:hypothetical protein
VKITHIKVGHYYECDFYGLRVVGICTDVNPGNDTCTIQTPDGTHMTVDARMVQRDVTTTRTQTQEGGAS